MENLLINLVSLLVADKCVIDTSVQVYYIYVIKGADDAFANTLTPMFISHMRMLLMCDPAPLNARIEQYLSISQRQLFLLRDEFAKELSI